MKVKFRAWHKIREEMYYNVERIGRRYNDGEKRSGINEDEFVAVLEESSLYVPMQYTGLKDREGQEIYDGDIIEYEVCGKDTSKGEVYFQEGAFWIGLENGSIRLLANLNRDWLTVVGNKFENPELLTSTKSDLRDKFYRCSSVVIDGNPGDNLNDFLRQAAIPIANELEGSSRVYVKWNGVKVEVRPGSSAKEIVQRYQRK